jgi:hypothetical protein
MKLSRKKRKFLVWLVILWFLVVTEYSVYAFDPIVPQERLHDIVQIGTITPTQFETLDKATIATILERNDVQFLLRKHFELLGMYGETKEGLFLRTPDDWSKYGNKVSLNGITFQKVYDVWFREKIQYQSELLSGKEEDLDAFFEKYFSSTEENRLTDGRIIGKDVSWSIFAYERGLPIAAGLLLAMYPLWWKKRKEDPLEDWGGLEDIYAETFKTNHENYGNFYVTLRADNRIYRYDNWFPRIWKFWQKANAKQENALRFSNGAKEIVSTAKNYISQRTNQQKTGFQNTLRKVLAKLSPEELRSMDNGTFDSQALSQFVEDIDYDTPLNELFPYQPPPIPPSDEIRLLTADAFLEEYEPLFEERQKRDYFKTTLLLAEALFQKTIGDQKRHCDERIKAIETEIIKSVQTIGELEQKVDPLKNPIQAHAEVYSEEFETRFDDLLQKLDKDHLEHVKYIHNQWTPLLSSPNHRERIRAQANLEGNLAYYEKEYKKARTKIKDYRSGKFFRDLACAKKTQKKSRDTFNNSQKQKRNAYQAKRKDMPSWKRVFQYLVGLESAGNNVFFKSERSSLLHLKVLQKEKQSLENLLRTPSPYGEEIKKLETQLQTTNHHSFEEYLARTGIQNTNWVVKDDWLRKKKNIGRSCCYWGQKYARYAQALMAGFSPYEERKIDVLREAAQRSHAERMRAYKGWEGFYKEHPLTHETKMSTFRSQLQALQVMETERKQLIKEQIETLEKRVSDKIQSAFTSAQWLIKTPEERLKDPLTEVILEAEINQSIAPDLIPIDSEALLRNFADVRDNQIDTQQAHITTIRNQKQRNLLTLDVERLIAPVIRQMHFNETPAGIAAKTRYFDAIKGTTKSEVVLPPPIRYQKNKNGTYTPIDRETGNIVEQPIFQSSIEAFPLSQVPQTISVEAVEIKKEAILNIGKAEEFQAQTQISLRKLLSVGSPLKFGLGVIDGIKSEIKGVLSLLNPLTWVEIAKVATKLHQLKQQFLLSVLTDPQGMVAHLKKTLPDIIPAIDQTWEQVQDRIANADDREKGAITASVILSLIPLGKIDKASKLTVWVGDIAGALNKFVPQSVR